MLANHLIERGVILCAINDTSLVFFLRFSYSSEEMFLFWSEIIKQVPRYNIGVMRIFAFLGLLCSWFTFPSIRPLRCLNGSFEDICHSCGISIRFTFINNRLRVPQGLNSDLD